jgi:hypothetical protein
MNTELQRTCPETLCCKGFPDIAFLFPANFFVLISLTSLAACAFQPIVYGLIFFKKILLLSKSIYICFSKKNSKKQL